MNYLQLPLIALAVSLLYFAYSTWSSWYRLRNFKGPWFASVSYLWMARTAISGRAWRIHMDLREKYGESLIRIGPEDLITDDPEIVRHINSARSRYKRDKWYNAFRLDPYIHSVLSTDDDGLHQEIKIRALPAYNGKGVPTLEVDIDEQIGSFQRYMRSKYLSTGSVTKPIDFATAVQYFTLDLMTKLALGAEWGFMAVDADIDRFVQTVAEYQPIMALTCDVPLMRKVLGSDLMLKLTGPKDTDATGMGRLMGIGNKAVATRFDSGGSDQRDMLGSFISNGLSKRQCEAEVILAVVAGSDTSAGLIRSTMLYVITSPLVYRKLTIEIDEAIAGGRASSPITVAESKALPYLQAVIYEGMRIHPPNQILLPKLTPPEGDTLGGRFVPGGTKISWNVWSLLRHKPTFGDDAYLFRPERWLEASPERKVEMERHVELVFGYGRYMCIGKHVAMITLSKIFVELLREFDFQLINPKTPWKEAQYSSFQLWDMWMRITEREK